MLRKSLLGLPSQLCNSLAILIFNLLIFSTLSQGQDLDTSNLVRTIDMRGKDPLLATAASIKTSRNDVVVILIRGGSEKLIEKTKGKLKALVHQGYERIGVILCDLNPGEAGAVIAVVSNGTMYAAIKKAEPTTTIMWQIYNLVRDAYKEHIVPKIKIDHPGNN